MSKSHRPLAQVGRKLLFDYWFNWLWFCYCPGALITTSVMRVSIFKPNFRSCLPLCNSKSRAWPRLWKSKKIGPIQNLGWFCSARQNASKLNDFRNFHSKVLEKFVKKLKVWIGVKLAIITHVLAKTCKTCIWICLVLKNREK